MKWLITGGCGFIGTSLVKNLVREKAHSIRIVDNLSVGGTEDLARVCRFREIGPGARNFQSPGGEENRVELIVGDIRDERLAFYACAGMDVIVHLAANTGVPLSVKEPKKDCHTNVVGTFNYLEAARRNGVGRFVFASSGAPIGECVPPIDEEKPCHPVSPYGASKLAGEAYCSAYFRTFGLETVALRFGNVYGPLSSHKNSVVAKFTKRALLGETLEIYGDGAQTRDFIYIDDLIRAIRLAAKVERIGGELFQIATGRETAVSELIRHLVGVMDKMGIGKTKLSYSKERLGDVRRNFSDTSKAESLLGWRCEVGLREGLARTVEWFVREAERRRVFEASCLQEGLRLVTDARGVANHLSR